MNSSSENREKPKAPRVRKYTCRITAVRAVLDDHGGPFKSREEAEAWALKRQRELLAQGIDEVRITIKHEGDHEE